MSRLERIKLAVAGAALCCGLAWQARASAAALVASTAKMAERAHRLRATPDQLMEHALLDAWPLFVAVRRLVPERGSLVLCEPRTDSAGAWAIGVVAQVLWSRNVMAWRGDRRLIERSWSDIGITVFYVDFDSSTDPALPAPWKVAYRADRLAVWRRMESRN